MNDWKKEIAYDEHIVRNNIVTIEQYPIVLKIKGLKNETMDSYQLLMERFDFKNILFKELKILDLLSTGVAVLEGTYKYPINLNDFEIELKFNGYEVKLEDLISEFKRKNAPYENEVLELTTVKTGEFFQYGKDILKKYYFKNEENFMKFKNLIYENNFCFPSDEKEKQELIAFIEKAMPEVKEFLLNSIPTIEERKKLLNKKQCKM